MKTMETIKGLTKEQTVRVLKKYIESNYIPKNDDYVFCADYVCLFISNENNIADFYIMEFISYWVKKMYGIKEHPEMGGFFGYKRNTENSLTRLAFVTLLIHELEK